MEHPAIMRPYIAFALASSLLDQINVENTDVPPRVSDHAGLLKFASHQGNACARHPHHLGKKFLRQWNVSADQLMHSKQPFARARLGRVQRVTGCRLLHLCEEELVVFDQQPAKGRNSRPPLRANGQQRRPRRCLAPALRHGSMRPCRRGPAWHRTRRHVRSYQSRWRRRRWSPPHTK